MNVYKAIRENGCTCANPRISWEHGKGIMCLGCQTRVGWREAAGFKEEEKKVNALVTTNISSDSWISTYRETQADHIIYLDRIGRTIGYQLDPVSIVKYNIINMPKNDPVPGTVGTITLKDIKTDLIVKVINNKTMSVPTEKEIISYEIKESVPLAIRSLISKQETGYDCPITFLSTKEVDLIDCEKCIHEKICDEVLQAIARKEKNK